ncbi:MAG: glutamine amidotransferase family protein [Halanaerobiales bacterium]|nr:glutamine amidotransferase family protein [Halanaerobiales bacterium]
MKIPSGCAIAGIMDTTGAKINGQQIREMIKVMHERSNGLGGGFAGYGIYPEYKDCYAFHIMAMTKESQNTLEVELSKDFTIELSEEIPTVLTKKIQNSPILWRYFLTLKENHIKNLDEDEEQITEFVKSRVLEWNHVLKDLYIVSSGKNMGVFKGVGYPEDLADFYQLEEYDGYIWTAHGRFPTNTPGWWAGAHPLALMDLSVVHNGEISSYGTNKRFLEMNNYYCDLRTDTEVIAYIIDLLNNKHKLPMELVYKVLAAPFWAKIDKSEDRELLTVLRKTYESALLNGPFSIIVANPTSMVGFNDRIKLRPMVVGYKGSKVYMASEEAAIRVVCPEPDKFAFPKAGEAVIAHLDQEVARVGKKVISL